MAKEKKTEEKKASEAVSEDTINQQVDALFKDPESEEPYKNLWQTFRQIMKHGLDHRQGNPLRRIVLHIKKAIEVAYEKHEAEEKRKEKERKEKRRRKKKSRKA